MSVPAKITWITLIRPVAAQVILLWKGLAKRYIECHLVPLWAFPPKSPGLGQFELKLFYRGRGRQNFASNVTLYPCERFRQNHLDTPSMPVLTLSFLAFYKLFQMYSLCSSPRSIKEKEMNGGWAGTQAIRCTVSSLTRRDKWSNHKWFKTYSYRVDSVIRDKLKDISNIKVIYHEQKKHSDLNQRGLHLTKPGTVKLAKNFIKHIYHNHRWDPSKEMSQLTAADTGSVIHEPGASKCAL